jgi:hypothetical protein
MRPVTAGAMAFYKLIRPTHKQNEAPVVLDSLPTSAFAIALAGVICIVAVTPAVDIRIKCHQTELHCQIRHVGRSYNHLFSNINCNSRNPVTVEIAKR